MVTSDTIEINWIADGGYPRSLYWAGMFTVPADGSDSFTFDSINVNSKTDGAMLASSDDTKTLTYEKGELIYEVLALGTTTISRFAKM